MLTPDQRAWLDLIRKEISSLKTAIETEQAYDQIEETIYQLLMDLNRVRPEQEGEALVQIGWQELEDRVNRVRQFIQLRVPRFILEYEMRWLKIKMAHFEQRLKGELPTLTPEEMMLKNTDLYDL